MSVQVAEERRRPEIMPDVRRGPAARGRMLPPHPRYEKPAGLRGGRGGRGGHAVQGARVLAGSPRRPGQVQQRIAPSTSHRGLPNRRRNAPMTMRGRGGHRGGRPQAAPAFLPVAPAAPPVTKANERIPKLVLKLPRPVADRSPSLSSSGSSSSGSGSESDSDSNSEGSGSGSSSSYSGSDVETGHPAFSYRGDRSSRGKSVYMNNQNAFYSDVGSNSMWSPVGSSSMQPTPLRSPGMAPDRPLLSSPFVSPTSSMAVEFPDNHDQSGELLSSPAFATNHMSSSPYMTIIGQNGPPPLSPSFESHGFQHSHS